MDALIDLDKRRIKDKELLFNLLRKVKSSLHHTEVALCTTRGEELDQDHLSNGGYPVARLVKVIRDETGIVIRQEFQCLSTPVIRRGIADIDQVLAEISRKECALDKNEILRLRQGRNYQLDELRIRYQQQFGNLPNESECVFVDDKKDVRATTSYRVVKAAEAPDVSTAYISDLTYELGLYNPLIQFLLGRTSDLNYNDFPNIQEMGFRDSPLVEFIGLGQIYKECSKVVNKAQISRYVYDLTFSAISRYRSLPLELKDDAAIAMIQFLHNESTFILEELRSAILQNKNPSDEIFPNLLRASNLLIALEEQYETNIGETYLKLRLRTMRSMLNNVASLKVAAIPGSKSADGKELKFVPPPEQWRSLGLYELARSQASAQATEPVVLGEIALYGRLRETFKKSASIRMTSLLNRLQFEYCAIPSTPALPKIDVPAPKTAVPDGDPTLPIQHYDAILTKIAVDITSGISVDVVLQGRRITDVLEFLSQIKLVLEDMKKIAPAIEQLAKFNPMAATDFTARIQTSLDGLDRLVQTAQAQPQYRAKLFLDKAQEYILSPQREWNAKGKARPYHVNQQLAEITAARNDGDYSGHMHAFIDLGRFKAQSGMLLSSPASKKHAKMFEGDNEDEIKQKLEAVFSNGAHPQYRHPA